MLNFCGSFIRVLFSFVSWLFGGLKGAEEKPKTDNNAPQIKHDVFVSFSGKDVHRGFLSHLTEAFRRRNIDAFVADKNLEKGEEIWPSLVEAIEGSSISLVIFSQNYASSDWCLEELVTILECREKYGTSVLPVFYYVEPTYVRHQSEVQRWRHALNLASRLAGINSSKFSGDAELVKEIVNEVLKRIVKQSINTKGLVGIDEKIAAIESLIREEPKQTRLIGIWGMGGVGKTTLAEEVFNKLQSEYEGSYFVASETDRSNKHELISLKENMFSKLLGYDVKIDTPNSLPKGIVRRIGCMKVLIVLDGVNESEQLEKLLGTLDNFGSGSRIIVTSRDEQVLRANKADKIYQLKEFNFDKALELFYLNAFKKNDHVQEYKELPKRVVDYAQGIPLVVKVLAGLLHGKNKEEWESMLGKLKKMPPKEVYEVMKLSYDSLDRKGKQIFLDLACFLCISSVKITTGYLKYLLKEDERDNSVVVALERLKDKALITFSKDNVVCMHDSIKEMAWEIVRQESPEDPGNRSRLWDPDDIYEAFKNDKVSEATRSIQINLLTLKGQKLKPHIAKMSRLRFVEIHGEEDNNAYYGRFGAEGQGLKFSATEIRFLFWKCYALKSLPDKFSFEKVVILKLELGRTEKLWDGVKNLVSLKELDLTGSRSLKKLPDLSKAKNIEVLCLGSCSGLTRLPSSLGNHTQLLYLDISHCPKILTIPELPLSLETLYAINCESLKTVSFHSTAVEQTKENRKQVSFDNCMNLDEPSLEAIGLNARFNFMKFSNQHQSAAKQDYFQNYNDYDKNYDSYQAFYVYPGNSVPEWLEYKSKKYSVIIDLSSAPPSPVYGFILCFVLLGELDKIRVNIVISDCEGKGVMDRFRMKLNRKFRNSFVHESSVESQKVVVMYDQRCSNFLNNIAKRLTRFKIMVRRATKDDGSFYSKRIMIGLSGFGVSIIRTSTYSSFMQQMELCDSMYHIR